VTSGLESEVQCIPQQMHELRTFPVPDHHKVFQNRIFACWEVGAYRARCCALSLALARPWGNWDVDSTRVSQLKLRGNATEPAQKPLIQIMIELCNHSKGGSLFQFGCQGIQAVVDVTRAFSRSARHQQTCNHASKQAAHQKDSIKLSKIVRALMACWALEVREHASNGQASVWARTCRWC
jgi:hypothetical protein